MAHEFQPDPGTRPHILLVEDSNTTKAKISKDLAELYTIISAADGEDAWSILRVDPSIELVLTDVHMPRLSGQQLLARMRKSDDPRISRLPVIVMTSADDNVDKNLAFLNGANDFVNKPTDPMELQARVNVHHRLATTIRELEASKIALAEQATTDPLTKLRNRRTFYELGEPMFASAARHNGEMAVILLDIDHFKKVNDTHGHEAGDAVLVTVSDLLRTTVRAMDVPARMGGEEFAILLPQTNRLGVAVMAERIRAVLEKLPIYYAGIQIPVTASLGIAAYGSDPADSLDDMLRIADRRLYMAKHGGRNRICVSDDGKSNFHQA